MNTAAAIAIIVLAALSAWLAYRNMSMAHKLGKYEQEREAHIIPDLEHMKQDNAQLFRDIEKILEGNQYVIDVHKERIERNKKLIFDVAKFIK